MNKFLTIILSFCFFIANSQTTCTHTFNTYDSYGDGWNGATVDIMVNGVTVLAGVYGIDNGNTGTTPIPGFCDANPFQASSGDAISLSNWVLGQYNSEISWDITDNNGNIIASGGTMVNGGGFGLSGNCTGVCVAPSWDCDGQGNCTDPGTGQGQYGSLAACQSACSPSPPCTHTFNMYDSYGDGWAGASVDVIVNGVTVVNGATGIYNNNNPGPCGSENFQASPGDIISLSNWDPGSYPPSNGEISWDIKDVYGNIIAFGGTLAAGGGFGLSGIVCTGSCPAPSWACDGSTGGCYDPGTGQGQYSSLASCQSACVVASWDCDGSTGGCYDPGTSQGQYNSLASCQSACVVASWDCDGSTGGCYDPGTGQGQYGSLAACQASCRPILSSSPSVPVDNISFLTSNQTATILPHPTNPSNYLNPGKIVRFKVEVKNKLNINLTSSQINMTPTNSSDPYVTVTTNQSGLNNITAGASRYTLSEFEIKIDSSCPPGHIFYADFQVIDQITSTSYSSTGYPIFIQPLINVEQSSPGVAPGTLIDDDSNPDSNGDDDHIVDPNETIELTPVLQESSNSLLNQLSLNTMKGCLKDTNNYPYVNIRSGVPGASGTIYSCLPPFSSFPGDWNVQQIQNNNYVLPPYDFVFDYTNTSTCKFDLFIEFQATTNYQFDPSWITRSSDIKWLTKVTINPNESPCNLPAPSWDCDPSTGGCTDPGTGQGQYGSLAACQSACVAASWDCDGQGNCTDPGTGQGQYGSLAACQSACVTPSWDCDFSMCYDPGTGFGTFASLAACQSVCNPTSTPFHEISNKIFPNPFKDKAFLELVGNDTESVLLFDIMGQFLREYKNIADKLIIERGNLSSGTYFLKIINKNSSIIQKIVVE